MTRGKLVRTEMVEDWLHGSVTGSYFVPQKIPPSVVESLRLGLEELDEGGETVSSALGTIRWLLPRDDRR